MSVVREGYTRAQALEAAGVGWGRLVARLFDYIEQHNLPVRVIQVKEKFGGLRFYYHPGVDTRTLDATVQAQYKTFTELVDQAEGKSYTVCDVCGESGTQVGRNWVRTRCTAHEEPERP